MKQNNQEPMEFTVVLSYPDWHTLSGEYFVHHTRSNNPCQAVASARIEIESGAREASRCGLGSKVVFVAEGWFENLADSL